MLAYWQAQHINHHAGGAVIAPWELLPGYDADDWAATALALSRLPELKQRKNAVNDYLKKFRASHPHYSSYRKN